MIGPLERSPIGMLLENVAKALGTAFGGGLPVAVN